jgi:transposase-like protein
MPITSSNPFKGRQFPGEVIVLCVRWYLRYPLAYEHVSELLAEHGVEWTRVASGDGSGLMRPN